MEIPIRSNKFQLRSFYIPYNKKRKLNFSEFRDANVSITFLDYFSVLWSPREGARCRSHLNPTQDIWQDHWKKRNKNVPPKRRLPCKESHGVNIERDRIFHNQCCKNF